MSRRQRVVAAWLIGITALGLDVMAGGALRAGGTTQPASAAGTVPFDTYGWKTDFSRHSVPLTEIMSGGPPKDGIPAIEHPKFVSVATAGAWLTPKEPVILFRHNGDVRAYPLQILIWHEIANDTVGELPVTVTFCPLCHTAIVFDRRAAGRVLDFGTTGRLRFSDLVMYDRQTESWWQQAAGEAIVGTLTGTRLTPLPAQIISWDTFSRTFPNGRVLSRETGYRRPYGRNPYAGYDSVDASPFLYSGPKDPRLRPMERVATVSIGDDDVAYPFGALAKVHVVNDTVGGKPIVVLFEKGVTSALDQASIAAGRDVGTAAVFDRTARGQTLTFAWTKGRVVDRETGSTWNILGAAVAGRLKGAHLAPVVHDQQFWFSWAVFRPKTRVYRPQ